MSTYEEIISEVTSSKPNVVKRVFQMLSDDLSRAILINLAEKQRIGYRELPLEKLKKSKISTLVTLDELESMGLVKSEMQKDNDRLHQVFTITEYGKGVVENLIRDR